MSSLFKINKEFLELQNQLLENGGEITEDIAKLMAKDDSDIREKAKNYRNIIKSFEADLLAVKQEKERIAAFEKSRKKSIEVLKNNLALSLQLREIDKLDFGVDGKISFRKSVSVFIEDEKALPTDYYIEKISYSPDKKLIKEAINSGEEVPGAVLLEKNNIQIK